MRWLAIGFCTAALVAFLVLGLGEGPDEAATPRADDPTGGPADLRAPPSAQTPPSPEERTTPDAGRLPDAARLAADDAGTGSLSGRVVDEDGAPLEGVVVFAREGDERSARWPTLLEPFGGAPRDAPDDPLPAVPGTGGRTDEDGRFRLEAVPAGARYTLLLHRDDRAPLRRGTFPAWSGRATDCGTLVLPPGGRVAGVVVDDRGRPIERATVGPVGPTATRPVETDTAGRFLLTGLEPGRRAFGAAAEGHVGAGAFERLVAEIVAGETAELRITLPRAASIEGRVVDESGAPMPRVPLVARREDDRRLRPNPTWARDDGSFVIDDLALGERYTLHVIDPALVRGEPVAATPPATGVALVTSRLPVVLVTAVDAHTGAPVALSSCGWRPDGESSRIRTVFSAPRPDGAPGRYRVPTTVEGTGRVSGTARGYEPAESEPLDPAGRPETGPIVLSFVPRPTPSGLHGVVRRASDGRAVAGARVALGRLASSSTALVVHGVPVVGASIEPWRTTDTTTDADGRFSFERRPGEGEALVVRADDTPSKTLSAAEVPPTTPDDPLELRLEEGGRVEGVVLGLDGRPAHDVPVVAYRAEQPIALARTAPDGGYSLDGLAPGTWACVPGDVYAEPSRNAGTDGPHLAVFEARRASHPTVRVTAGETARLDLDVRTLGGGLAGRLVVDGVPRKSHRVWLRPASRIDDSVHTEARLAWTGHGGDFAFTRVPPGAYALAATSDHSAHPLVETTVHVTRGRVERVELAVTTGTVRGIVRVVGRSYVPRGNVRVRTGGGAREAVATTSNREDGTFELPGIPPGRYAVEASIRDVGTQTRPAEVAAGGTTEVSFLLDAPARIEVTFTGLAPEVDLLHVELTRNGAPALERLVRRRSDGVFAVEGVEPGRYRLVVASSRFFAAGSEPTALGEADVEARRGETTTVEFEVAEED